MSTPVEKPITALPAKSVKLSIETWKSLSHESTDQNIPMMELVTLAWAEFMDQPESVRARKIAAFRERGAA